MIDSKHTIEKIRKVSKAHAIIKIDPAFIDRQCMGGDEGVFGDVRLCKLVRSLRGRLRLWASIFTLPPGNH